MWPYWLLFLVPAVVAATDRRLHLPYSAWAQLDRAPSVEWVGVGILIVLLVGARYQVGGDWGNYEVNLRSLTGLSLAESLAMGDPGYQLFSWLSLQMGWGMVAINTVAAAIFSVGLVAFCRAMPQPALALAVAVPYLVVVVAMGYTRQGVAIGLAMLGMLALQRGRLPWFVFLVLLGATFHKSAVLLLPIAGLAAAKNRFWATAWGLGAAAMGYFVLVEDSVDNLVTNYIDAEYQSSGTFIRLLMNVVPAVLMLKWRLNFFPDRGERMLWSWFAVISLVLFLVFFLTPASTALDRVALYMLPLQLAVFSRAPAVFGGAQGKVGDWTLLVLSYYALVLFVWLNFADNSQYWLPYRFYPLEVLLGNI